MQQFHDVFIGSIMLLTILIYSLVYAHILSYATELDRQRAKEYLLHDKLRGNRRFVGSFSGNWDVYFSNAHVYCLL